jgi:hypothetical protein
MAAVKKGALHKQLGLPLHSPISTKTLKDILRMKEGGKIKGRTVTKLMKKRANFALNFR